MARNGELYTIRLRPKQCLEKELTRFVKENRKLTVSKDVIS